MTIRRGLPAKLALTDADDTRYLFSGLFVCNADGSPRSGVLSPVGTNLVTATATMNVSVKRFHGTAERDGGNVLLAVDGVTDVLLDSAPGANSRIDVIYAKQNDASGTVTVPDGDNLPVLSFAKGTAGAVPVKPSLPVGALEVATVLLPSSATATNSVGVVITQTAQFTASAGGVVPFRTKAELDLWTTASSGQSATDIATGITYRYNGTKWISAQPSRIKNTRNSGYSMGANGVMYIFAGVGSTRPVFGVPVSDLTLTLSGDVYSNSEFEWNRSTGELKVKTDGTYELEFRGSASPLASGTVDIGITKNSTSLGATSDTLARDGKANLASVSASLLARNPAEPLLTTDVIRFIGFIFGASGAITFGNSGPNETYFSVKRVG